MISELSITQFWDKKKQREKKNGAHKHLSSSLATLHQNIHVMLSYANKPQKQQI